MKIDEDSSAYSETDGQTNRRRQRRPKLASGKKKLFGSWNWPQVHLAIWHSCSGETPLFHNKQLQGDDNSVKWLIEIKQSLLAIMLIKLSTHTASLYTLAN